VAPFPSNADLKVHFAHSAYRLAERFVPRMPEVAHFQTWTAEETRARIGEGDVLVASGFWDNAMLADAGSLKFIQVCAVGYDQFDRAAIAEQGIRMANAAGVNANAVSDHAMALLLGLTRQLHHARDNQRARRWRGMISDIEAREDELPGKTMVIYGVGRIGARIARLARAFGMTVIGIKRDLSVAVPEVDVLKGPDEFVEALAEADVVVLSCPLTGETSGLMNAAAFAAMRPSAFLINVARGGCVDQGALIAALEGRRIAGAGIDVTVPEPLPDGSPLWAFDNVILTPHTGGETRQYEENVLDALVENIGRLQRGEPDLLNQIV
jgi:phosphoglycerate dehydrogenase-like enzyme